MQNNIDQYLAPVLNRAAEKKRLRLSQKARKTEDFIKATIADESASMVIKIPPEFYPKEYLTFLLHIDAEIQHGLMIQYLYSAYSLGGAQVPESDRPKVKAWLEIILGIAKEEMRHFISVQNVLMLIGAPLNFGRQDYPWDTPFYPFPFKFELFPPKNKKET